MVSEPTTREVLGRLDLAAVRQRLVDEGFAVTPYPRPEHPAADHCVVVRAVREDHLARLEHARDDSTEAVLPLDRELCGWATQLRLTVSLLRAATGRTHADLGPTTQAEAAFAVGQNHGSVAGSGG